MTLRRCWAGGDGIGEPTTLVPEIWIGKQRVTADCGILLAVASNQENPLSPLLFADERTADCTV